MSTASSLLQLLFEITERQLLSIRRNLSFSRGGHIDKWELRNSMNFLGTLHACGLKQVNERTLCFR